MGAWCVIVCYQFVVGFVLVVVKELGDDHLKVLLAVLDVLLDDASGCIVAMDVCVVVQVGRAVVFDVLSLCVLCGEDFLAREELVGLQRLDSHELKFFLLRIMFVHHEGLAIDETPTDKLF